MSGSSGTRLAGHLAARLGTWLSCSRRQLPTGDPVTARGLLPWGPLVCALSVASDAPATRWLRQRIVGKAFPQPAAAGHWTCSRARRCPRMGLPRCARPGRGRHRSVPVCRQQPRLRAICELGKRGDGFRARVSDAACVGILASSAGRQSAHRGLSSPPRSTKTTIACYAQYRLDPGVERAKFPGSTPIPTASGRNPRSSPRLTHPRRQIDRLAGANAVARRPVPTIRPRPCAQTARCPPISLSAPPGGGTWT
jgi:hypothetical protein